VAGSASTLRAAAELGRRGYGFEIKKDFYELAQGTMLRTFQLSLPLEAEIVMADGRERQAELAKAGNKPNQTTNKQNQQNKGENK
jgi:hypothetical protein